MENVWHRFIVNLEAI